MKINKIFIILVVLYLMAIAPAYAQEESHIAEYTDSFEGSKISFSMESRGFAMEEESEKLVLKGIARIHRVFVGEFGSKYKKNKKRTFQNKADANFSIKLFNSLEEFRKYALTISRGKIKFSGEGRAFYAPWRKLLVIYLKSDTFPTIFHEVSHFFYDSQFAGGTQGKLWLNEGLAMYFQGLDMFQAGGVTVQPNERAYLTLNHLEKEKALPKLKDYLSLSREEWTGKDEGLNYYIGWSLIYFMMDSEDGSDMLDKILEYSKAGGSVKKQKKRHAVSVASLIERYYKTGKKKKGGLKKFEDEWLAFLKEGAVPAPHNI